MKSTRKRLESIGEAESLQNRLLGMITSTETYHLTLLKKVRTAIHAVLTTWVTQSKGSRHYSRYYLYGSTLL